MEWIHEAHYAEEMEKTAEPYLAKRRKDLFFPAQQKKAGKERLFPAQQKEAGKNRKLHVVRYTADQPKGVLVISHGFTESAPKYEELAFYLLQAGYHVYLPEHMGHGTSYRMTEDPSMVYVDHWKRYVRELLQVCHAAKSENPELPLSLFAHSMGGGIGASAAATEPELFYRVVLSSPMIRPLTGKVPFADAKRIAAFACATERGTQYVVGQKPYQGIESFKQSSSLSRPRFRYYQQKREKEPLYHLNAASYGWLHAAAHLYRDLMRSGWKRIEAPVLLFQAENDHLVSNRAQERMIRKMAERRPGMAKMVKVPGAKHELFGTRGRMLQTYWNMVFAFLEKDL